MEENAGTLTVYLIEYTLILGYDTVATGKEEQGA